MAESRHQRLLVLLAVVVLVVLGVGLFAALRVARVQRAAKAIPVQPGAREGARHVRYFPRPFAWDDRSSARVRRIFSLADSVSLDAVARSAHASLVSAGWYLVDPRELGRMQEPQVVVWQRDPDERLDLVRLWPIRGMTRQQRLHGGLFPAALLDMPMVFEWTWALGGPRSQRPTPRSPGALVSPTPR